MLNHPRSDSAALVLLLLVGCRSTEFDHGGSPSGFATISGGTGVGANDDDLPRGNYPEPAITRCGDLGDEPSIAGLSSAWAVVAVPDATLDGEAVAPNSVFLRISQDAIDDCGDAPGPPAGGTGTGVFGSSSGDGDEVTEGRTLELLLSPAESAVGVHPIDPLAHEDVTLYGDGATDAFGTGARVELLHVDDDCVVGILHGFEADDGAPFMQGGFVAQTCQRQCIPANGNSC